MKLNCCIIIKDDSELPQLHNAITSVIPFFDGIYITANGKDVKKIEEYCKQSDKIHYSYLKWDDDFSKQRNFNFSQAPQDSDYIFWMDADDILVGGPKINEVASIAKENGKDVVFFTYWYGCSFNGEPSVKTITSVDMEHMRERLIRPGTMKWMGRLHETPVPLSGVRNNYTSYPYDEKDRPIAIMHTADLSRAMKNMERNKRILELQLKEEISRGGADPRTLLYLIKIYAEEDNKENWEKALTYGEEYIKKSGWDEERGTCHEQMAIIYGKMEDEQMVIKELHEAIREWSNQPLFYIRLAQAYYNVKNYRAAKHWLGIASTMDLDSKGSNITNFKAMKVMFAELLMKLSYNVDKDTKKSLQSAKLLFMEQPTKENKEQVDFISDLNDLNDACHNVHLVAKYLNSIGDDTSVIKMLDVLPEAITKQPFAINIRKSLTPSRKWLPNEICYFANFGQAHFEKWDPTSMNKGIGGSETAVIRLSQELSNKGFHVTVYGDPIKKGTYGNVTYLPWYYFNPRDSFSIFIQWRGWQLADKIKAKLFYVDLHDIYSPIDITPSQLCHIDKFMVKSDYHRNLAPLIPNEKFLVISNGIDIDKMPNDIKYGI